MAGVGELGVVEQHVFWELDADDQPTDRPVTEVHLKQVSPKYFVLTRGFHYTGAGPKAPYTVLPDGLGWTDLASIPRLLRWFVGTYGRHTLAALLHDYLCRLQRALIEARMPEAEDTDRAEADLVFRHALRELDVSVARSWLMWTAVTAGARVKRAARLAGMVVWALVVVAGLVHAMKAAGDGETVRVVVALIVPFAGAALWGRQWAAGLIATPALGPVLAIVIVLSAYRLVLWFIEYDVWLLTGGRGRAPRPFD